MGINSKSELRKKYLHIREAMPDEIYFSASKEIARLFTESDFYKNAETVLLYMSIKKEVDTHSLSQKVFSDKKAVALPVSFPDGKMTFRYITQETSLTCGNFSVPEPPKSAPEYKYSEKTLCIVPGIAFDRKGYRLGYGKGYYDRYLASSRVFTVGFCFDEVFTEELPHESTDIACDAIITQKGIFIPDEKK